jgi:hypothetical protein
MSTILRKVHMLNHNLQPNYNEDYSTEHFHLFAEVLSRFFAKEDAKHRGEKGNTANNNDGKGKVYLEHPKANAHN